jgi:sec-independent protein translocase protein TatC
VSAEDVGRRRLSRRRSSASPDGRMTLVEHLRELRNRLMWAFLGIALGTAGSWVFYPQVFKVLQEPFKKASAAFGNGQQPELTLTGVADAFNLQLQVSVGAGIVLSSPIWMYQLFRFVTPGMHKNERKYAGLFVASALPLFLGGVAAAYYVLPHILGAFLGFTPKGVVNIISVDKYMSFLIQIMVVFGIGCIAPVVIVVLNGIGILSARRFASWWRWTVFLTLVFAAFATPTGDPFNMLLFASPLLVLMFVAFLICWSTDRRRARRDRADGLADLDDDETSPLTFTRDQTDDQPSDIHGSDD